MNPYIGQTLGSYQILEQIGQGGMATIFKAYQPSMDRYVAIKVLPSHFTEDESFVARFMQEARTLARLEHPHILPVHDFGEQDGTTYLVMRYIEAGTLKDLIARRGPLDLKEATRIMGQVGGALGYAHSQGVIHRDIKPTNVLIDERDNAFLTDFGIAKLVAGTAQFTATGAIVGTPAYMSPEQGMAEKVDHRSDIYALGVVLYEMVVGKVPYEAETPLAVLLKHVNAPLPPPRQIKADLPEAVERVILKAMAKGPDDRFQAAEAMVEALNRAVAGLPTEVSLPRAAPDAQVETVRPEPAQVHPEAPTIDARPGARPEPVIAAPRRKMRPWLFIGGGAMLLVAALIGALLLLSGSGDGAKATATPKEAAARSTPKPTVTEIVIPATTPTSTATPEPPPTPTSEPGAPTPEIPLVMGQLSPGWTNFSNANSVNALARQGDYLWAGGEAGLVRWDLQDGSYVKFGVSDGMASNSVNDLLVDDEDVLWVATDAGINRFDGETWLTFDEADGLDTEWVLTLYLEDDGSLWAGTSFGESGLNYYDGSRWGAPPIPPLPIDYPSVSAIFVDEEEGLLVGTELDGLAFFDGVEWTRLTSEDGLPSDFVQDFLITDDALWIGFDYDVARIDTETGEMEAIPQLEYVGARALYEADDGGVWFATDGAAIRYDPETGDWQQFEAGSGTVPGWTVTDIVQDDEGMWISTYDGGVVFYDGSTWEPWVTDDELAANSIEAIVQDGTGALWFVHGGAGLSRYDPVNDDWQAFGESEGALDWPSYPGVDGNGHVWIGGYGELKRHDGRAWQTFTYPQLADAVIYGIDFDGDVVWLWTDIGVVRYNPATDGLSVYTSDDHPALQDVETLHVAADGGVWAGGSEGLALFDGQDWITPSASGDPPEWVSDIASAPDGGLWVVADGLLFQLDEDRWIRFSWPNEGWIEKLTVGPDGAVWVGYEGLGRFDPLSSAWQTFTPADGLADESVQAIYVTPDGVVWVGTEGGVSRYVPER